MPELNYTILKNSANLKAYYRMSTGALTTDSSGNGYTLTNTNTVADGTGKFGGAADFGATNSNKWLNLSDDYGINGSNVSISIWVKLSAFPASGNVYFPIFISDDGTDTAFQIVFYNNGTSRLISFHRIRNGVGQEGVAYFAFDPGTEWHHYVLTYDSTNVRGYIDGAIRGTGAASGNGTTALAQLTGIGANMDGGYLSGIIDDVAIFNTPLSADQIKELYEGRYVGEGWPQSGLVAGYHLNGNSTDYSGNGNNGTDTAITYSLANGKFNQGGLWTRTSNSKIVNTAFSGSSANWTYSFWIKRASVGTIQHMIGHYTNGNNALVFDISATNILETYQYNGSTFPTVSTTKTITDTTTWHYIVLVKSGATETIYIDGNQEATGTSNNLTIGSTLAIGRDNLNNTNSFDGAFDEIQVYNVAKDANWVRKQYAWSVGKFL